MAVISWDPLFESGDATIDEQHRSLVTTINRLDAAQTWGTGAQAMDFVLEELERYAAVHFHTEESFFAEVDYPLAEEHRAEHRYFEQRLSELRRQHEAGDRSAVTALLGVLGSWFVHHVSDVDVKYRPYLAKRI